MIKGPYGFHSIWQNMENFFTAQNIQDVRALLKELAINNSNHASSEKF